MSLDEDSWLPHIKRGTPANFVWVQLQTDLKRKEETAGIYKLEDQLHSLQDSEKYTPEGKKSYERPRGLLYKMNWVYYTLVCANDA